MLGDSRDTDTSLLDNVLTDAIGRVYKRCSIRYSNPIPTFNDLREELANWRDAEKMQRTIDEAHLAAIKLRSWTEGGIYAKLFDEPTTMRLDSDCELDRSSRGYFADELALVLHVEVQDALRQLTQQGRVSRQIVSGRYLYTATDPSAQKRQLLARRTVELLPTVANVSVLEVAPEEVKAAILLFYSLLDEQQHRLYAGLESLKLGRGGDRQLADFLDLDPHTVARGRQQLLAQDVEVDRARRAGAGRKPVEKKRPK